MLVSGCGWLGFSWRTGFGNGEIGQSWVWGGGGRGGFCVRGEEKVGKGGSGFWLGCGWKWVQDWGQ